MDDTEAPTPTDDALDYGSWLLSVVPLRAVRYDDRWVESWQDREFTASMCWMRYKMGVVIKFHTSATTGMTLSVSPGDRGSWRRCGAWVCGSFAGGFPGVERLQVMLVSARPIDMDLEDVGLPHQTMCELGIRPPRVMIYQTYKQLTVGLIDWRARGNPSGLDVLSNGGSDPG